MSRTRIQERNKSKSRGRDRKGKRARRRKNADPYQMNQDRDQRAPHEYLTGDPSSWAAVPHEELPNDEELGRNEIGMYNMPQWAYDHKDAEEWNSDQPYDNAFTFSEEDRNRRPEPENLAAVENYDAYPGTEGPTASRGGGNWYERSKRQSSSRTSSNDNWYERSKSSSRDNWYDGSTSEAYTRDVTADEETMERLEKKASRCIDIAETMLGKEADREHIEDQAYDLMPLPERSIDSTLQRLDVDEKSTEAMYNEMVQDEIGETRTRAEDDEEDMDEAEEAEESDDGDDIDEEEAEAMIDEVLERQQESTEQQEEVVDTLNEEQTRARSEQSGDDLDIEMEPSMNTVGGSPEEQLDREAEELRQLFEADLPEGAKRNADQNKGEFSGRDQQTTASDESVDTLGGSVKQASDHDEAEELEKIWEEDADVSGAF